MLIGEEQGVAGTHVQFSFWLGEEGVEKGVETSARSFDFVSFNFRGAYFVVEVLEKHAERNDRNNRKKHRI